MYRTRHDMINLVLVGSVYSTVDTQQKCYLFPYSLCGGWFCVPSVPCPWVQLMATDFGTDQHVVLSYSFFEPRQDNVQGVDLSLLFLYFSRVWDLLFFCYLYLQFCLLIGDACHSNSLTTMLALGCLRHYWCDKQPTVLLYFETPYSE